MKGARLVYLRETVQAGRTHETREQNKEKIQEVVGLLLPLARVKETNMVARRYIAAAYLWSLVTIWAMYPCLLLWHWKAKTMGKSNTCSSKA